MIVDLETRLPLPPSGMKPLGEALTMTALPRSENIIHSRRKKKLAHRRLRTPRPSSWPKIAAAKTRCHLGPAAEVTCPTYPQWHLHVVAAA
jgi:hypothetical protein